MLKRKQSPKPWQNIRIVTPGRITGLGASTAVVGSAVGDRFRWRLRLDPPEAFFLDEVLFLAMFLRIARIQMHEVGRVVLLV